MTQSGCVRASEVCNVASYQSSGVHTTMLLSGTTLNKAHLLDWSVTLCVLLLDFCRHTIFSIRISQETRDRVFFEVIDPKLSLLRLIRKGVITEDVKSSIDTSNTKDAQEVLYHHLAHHANVDTLMKYCEVAIDAEGYPKMQSLGRKMKEELEQGARGWSKLCTCVGDVCVYVHARMSACVHACVRVCVRVCVRACVRACMHT